MATPLMYVPKDNGFQNQMFSLLSNVIMNKIAYDQQSEMFDKRKSALDEQQSKEIMFNAGMEGRDVLQTDAGKVPEGYVQNPYNTTQFIGPKPKESSEWTPVEYNGQVFGISNGRQVLNVPETWKQGEPIKLPGGKTLFPQTNQRTNEVKYKEVDTKSEKWSPKSMGEALEYYKQQKSIDAKYDLKNSVSKDAKENPDKLRKEFIQQSKTFVDVQDSYRRVEASAEDPSAAGDLAMIFNYMKILDPGSVVRESEFATAQNAAGVPERLRAKYNQVLNGEKLSPATREDFLVRSRKLFEKQKQTHNKLRNEYDRIAKNMGVEPSNVVIDYIMKDDKSGGGNTSTKSLADQYIEKYGKR